MLALGLKAAPLGLLKLMEIGVLNRPRNRQKKKKKIEKGVMTVVMWGPFSPKSLTLNPNPRCIIPRPRKTGARLDLRNRSLLCEAMEPQVRV